MKKTVVSLLLAASMTVSNIPAWNYQVFGEMIDEISISADGVSEEAVSQQEQDSVVADSASILDEQKTDDDHEGDYAEAANQEEVLPEDEIGFIEDELQINDDDQLLYEDSFEEDSFEEDSFEEDYLYETEEATNATAETILEESIEESALNTMDHTVDDDDDLDDDDDDDEEEETEEVRETVASIELFYNGDEFYNPASDSFLGGKGHGNYVTAKVTTVEGNSYQIDHWDPSLYTRQIDGYLNHAMTYRNGPFEPIGVLIGKGDKNNYYPFTTFCYYKEVKAYPFVLDRPETIDEMAEAAIDIALPEQPVGASIISLEEEVPVGGGEGDLWLELQNPFPESERPASQEYSLRLQTYSTPMNGSLEIIAKNTAYGACDLIYETELENTSSIEVPVGFSYLPEYAHNTESIFIHLHRDNGFAEYAGLKVGAQSEVQSITLPDVTRTYIENMVEVQAPWDLKEVYQSIKADFHYADDVAAECAFPFSTYTNDEGKSCFYGLDRYNHIVLLYIRDRSGNQIDYDKAAEEGLVPGIYTMQVSTQDGSVVSNEATLTITDDTPYCAYSLEDDCSGTGGTCAIGKGYARLEGLSVNEPGDYTLSIQDQNVGTVRMALFAYTADDEDDEEGEGDGQQVFRLIDDIRMDLSTNPDPWNVYIKNKAYLLLTYIPDGEESFNGMLYFSRSEGAYQEDTPDYEAMQAEAVELTPGETYTAHWDSSEQNHNYYKYTPEEEGTYKFYSLGYTDTRVKAYAYSDGEFECIDEDDDDGEDCNFLISFTMHPGTTYYFDTYSFYSDGLEGTSTIHFDLRKTIESAALSYEGQSPIFVEGLWCGYTHAPFEFYYDPEIDLAYEGGSHSKYNDVQASPWREVYTKEGETLIFVPFQIQKDGSAVIFGDDDDNPDTYGNPLPAGNWLLALSSGNKLIPAPGKTMTGPMDTENASTIPFTVITMEEACTGSLNNGPVTLDPKSAYYAGASYTPDKTGTVRIVTDLALDDLRIYKKPAGSEDNFFDYSTPKKVDSVTFQADLEAESTYYIFGRSYKESSFTISIEEVPGIKDVKVTTILPETLEVGTNYLHAGDFGVDLTYDNGMTVHLNGCDSDIYGNNFKYSVSSDDVSGYDLYLYGDDFLIPSPGKYTVNAYLDTYDVSSSNEVHVSTPSGYQIETMKLNEQKEVPAGQVGIFDFMPEESGWYSVLSNGEYLSQCMYNKAYSSIGGYVRPDLAYRIFRLGIGQHYYIQTEPGAKQTVSITRRYPVTIGSEGITKEFEIVNGRSQQFFFTMAKEAPYEISVHYSEDVKEGSSVSLTTALSSGEDDLDYDESNLIGSYRQDSKVSKYLSDKNVYLLNILPGSDEDQSGTVTFSIKPYEEGQTQPEKPQVEFLIPNTVNCPVEFAGYYLQQKMQVKETLGDSSVTLEMNQTSPYTKQYYVIGGITPIDGSDTRMNVRVYAYGGDEDGGPYIIPVEFTGSLSDLPAVTKEIASSGTQMGDGWWFFAFTPDVSSEYLCSVMDVNGAYVYLLDNEGDMDQIYGKKELTAGNRYVIAVEPYGLDEGKTPRLMMQQVQGVEDITILKASEIILPMLKNKGAPGAEVMVTYADGSEEVYTLEITSSDKYGDHISAAYVPSPVPAGSSPKVSLTVTLEGKKAEGLYDLTPVSSDKIQDAYLSEADALAHAFDTSGGMTYKIYRFVPAETGAYKLNSAGSNKIGDIWNYAEWYDENGSRRISNEKKPLLLHAGKTYLICYWVRGGSKDNHCWIDKLDESGTSDGFATLTYAFVDEDGKAVPEIVNAALPVPNGQITYPRLSEIVPASPKQETVNADDGVWTFVGYEETVVRLEADMTLKGIWSFEAAQTYQLVYKFESGTEGHDLPKAVTDLLPEPKGYMEGVSITPKEPAEARIDTADGYWEFKGYKPATLTMTTAGAEVIGTWNFVEMKQYPVHYVFVSITSGKDLPESFVPVPEDILVPEGESAADKLTDPSEKIFKVEDGVWSFEGYDTESLPATVTGEMTVNGRWKFETVAEAAQDAVDTINSQEGSIEDVLDVLDKSDSSSILGQYQDETGEIPEEKITQVETLTQAIDDKLTDPAGAGQTPDPGKKITNQSALQSGEDYGIFVGPTKSGEDNAGLKADVSGAAATVAGVIRNAGHDELKQNDGKHYQAVVDVKVVEQIPGESLKFELNLDIVIEESGETVGTDVSLSAPVTVTLTIPEAFIGYDFDLIHVVGGAEQKVNYTKSADGKTVTFAVSHFSEFKLKNLTCHHKIKHVPAKAATCKDPGNIEYWICEGPCGKIFRTADLKPEDEIKLADTVIPVHENHTWNNGEVTKPATVTETGIKLYTCDVCGKTRTETLEKLPNPEEDAKDPTSIAAAEKTVTAVSDSGEPAGSSFVKIQLQSKKQSKNSLTLNWNKVNGAAGYILYGAVRGKANKLSRITKITNGGTTSYTWKGLKADTYYKFVLVAYAKNGSAEKQLAISKQTYAATTNKKFTNVSKVTVKAKKVTLKKGKTASIKATQVLAKKKLKLTKCKKIRFECDKTNIATVSASGKIKAKSPGSCTIYVFSQNGTFVKVKVKVTK